MRHAAEPIVACLQLRHAGRESSTPAEEEDTVKGDRQNEQRKEASVRLGDVMRRTREWMAPNVYYSRIHSSSLPLWRGSAASGRSEAQGREGQASALRWPAANNSAPLASTLLRTTIYDIVASSYVGIRASSLTSGGLQRRTVCDRLRGVMGKWRFLACDCAQAQT